MSKKQILFTSLGIIIAISILIFVYYLFLKPCDHEWLNATCENPATCKFCGETAGEPLGHDWIDADCENPAICSACNLTRGSPLGHKWIDATCIVAKTCSICGKTEGEPLGHVWTDATCTLAKTCSVCGETEGEPLERSYIPSYSSGSNDSGSSSGGSESSRSGFKYGCSISGCPYPAKCVNGVYGSYCEFHGCRVPGCLNIPIGGSYYCATHIDNH